MNMIFRRPIRTGLLCAALAAIPCMVIAQSGSMGGSLGNDDKSLSGSRSEPRAPAPDRPARPAKPAAAQRSGGGGGNYNGSWTVVAMGNCASAGAVTIIISGGQVVGPGISGTVSSGGAVSTVSNVNGMSVIGNGQLSGRSGSGYYRQADGCSGNYRAAKN